MRTSLFQLSARFFGILWFLSIFSLLGAPVASVAAGVVTPQVIQGYISHADPAKALTLLAPILKEDPHSAKAWYLDAEALDASGQDPQAKIALGTAEHLAPSMPFANQRSLRELEHRVGLANVQASKESSKLFHGLLWFLALVLIAGIGAYVYIRSIRKNNDAIAESDRQDILLAITQYLTGDMDAARISADAHGDTDRLASIESWKKSLLDCAQSLKDAANADADTKRDVTARGNAILAEVRARMSGHVVSHPNGDDVSHNVYGPNDVWVDNSTIADERNSISSGMGRSNRVYADTIQNDSYAGGNAGGSFGSALENGLGMGIGMEIAEDLMGGNRGLSADNQTNSSFGGDDNGLSFGGGFGGADDGLSSGSDRFGGADDGLSGGVDSFGGGADDGLSSSDDSADDGLSSGDDSW